MLAYFLGVGINLNTDAFRPQSPGNSLIVPEAVRLELGYRIDHFGAAMFAMVTFVATLIHVFALAQLAGDAGSGPPAASELAAAGLAGLVRRYADREYGGWFSQLDFAGQVTDPTKENYAHAHTLLAASTAIIHGFGLPAGRLLLFPDHNCIRIAWANRSKPTIPASTDISR